MAKDTEKLNDALNNNNGVYELFYLIFNSDKTTVKQYAAVVLRKHFSNDENWKKYNNEEQINFRESTLRATLSENKILILNALAQLLAKMLHRGDALWVTKVFDELCQQFSSPNPIVVERASLIFVILTENAPECLMPHAKQICEMTYAVLGAAERRDDRVTSTTLNTLSGASNMIFYMSECDVKKTFDAALPTLFLMLTVYSEGRGENDCDNLGMTFDVIEEFSNAAPMILKPHLRRLVAICLHTAFNGELEDGIRARVIYALCWLVEENMSEMNNMQLVFPVVKGIFDLIVNCAKEEVANDLVADDDDSSPLSAACDAMDTFSNHIPSNELYPLLMDLMKNAMESECEGFRRAALIILAVTVEGFSDAILTCNHVAYWVNMIKTGVYDPSVYVRCAAFYALGQCTDYLQPEIIKYSKDIMPVMLEFLNTSCSNVKKSETERKYVGLIFFALNYFCSSLSCNELQQYLPTLLTKLLECAATNVNAKNFRQMAFESIGVVIRKVNENIVPYMGQIIPLLQPYLGKCTTTSDKELRSMAISTLEDLATAVGKEYFQPLMRDSIQLILLIIGDLEDDDEGLGVLFSFTAAITNLYPDMAGLFMHRVVECVFNVGLIRNLPDFDSDNMEIDYENYSDEENEQDLATNQLLCESMTLLATFSKCCAATFKEYLRPSFDKCFILITDHSEIVRQSAIESCSELIDQILCNDNERSEIIQGVNQFAYKIIECLGTEKKLGVGADLINALQNYVTSYSKIAKLDEPIINTIVELIISGLKGELQCQVEFYIDRDNDKQHELALQISITTLLNNLSTSISQEEFLVCFEKICPVLLDVLESADGNHEWIDDRKAISIYCMGACVTALGKNSAKYYDAIFNLMFNGLKNESVYIQNDAMYGLGELVYQAGPCSYASFPHILKELSRLSQDSGTENKEMICFTLARLILTNHALVPAKEVLPIMVQNAPFKEHIKENLMLFESFKLLYVEERELFLQYFKEIIARGLQLIDNVNKKIIEEECHITACELVHALRNTHPEHFQMVLTENPELNKVINCE